MSIAVLHEHPKWNAPLFGELDRRGLEWVSIDASSPEFEPTLVGGWDVLVNRMSPSAWTRGHMNAMLQTPEFLLNVESAGVPVINGSASFEFELSKRLQLDLLRRERVRHPEGRPVLNSGEIVGAAIDLAFPVLVKPNIGGSGAGITEHQTPTELAAAVEEGLVDDLGPDGTGLVQEKLPARGNSIVRVEILNGKFLYAIRLQLHADVGGVEYVVNDLDGEAYFYDINALSNFVADPANVVGFDPFVQLVDFIEDRAKQRVPA